MATEFILKVRNPELKDQLEEIVGVINTLEDDVAALETGVEALEAGVEAVAVSGAPVAPVAATGALTIATQPTAADTITIAQGDVTEVYTFVEVAEDEVAEDDFDVALGLDVDATQTALAAVINEHSALVTAGAFAANASVITAKVKGVIGNTIATTSGLTDEDETDGFAAATLGTGVDGTEGLDGQIRYASDRIYVSVGVSTTAVSNWKGAALS